MLEGNYEAILASIAGFRAESPTAVRFMSMDDPFVGLHEAHLQRPGRTSAIRPSIWRPTTATRATSRSGVIADELMRPGDPRAGLTRIAPEAVGLSCCCRALLYVR